MNGKRAAGRKAVEEVKDGMTIGLGTGSTVYYFLEALAEKVADGFHMTGVATSQKTIDLAHQWNIPMQPLNAVKTIDITIDGADEVDASLNGIKGGGGALLYEKLVAKASKRRIWIVDNSKKVEQLGAFPLPVEVVPFGWKQIETYLEEKGAQPQLRRGDDNEPYITDAKHYILDLHLPSITDPHALADELDHLTGVVEHGLFLNMTDKVIIGYPDGQTETLAK
ncbi:ribose-5-phosphate isomerase RpiA [Sporolactobacillus inulinus]|jgi:ribose 5-phosphate isomerase A|uniref:Ribose-5-phosphate isomerase A n=1 Tax=Sporolactobacillus inulinus CASD TaxID=1069536 RepID=A0A0U1QQS4_9BACL|nr:ribose-5-phosphate isomerase RpiA [Sporolactobacillus inulinus]KLI03159.1 ribose 5-phosphate isomerase [Sporolactobacillus inulinus CASD]GEB76641.1 ribose-5-phosphate isomerase A [Sporolactobacillus inulinus]